MDLGWIQPVQGDHSLLCNLFFPFHWEKVQQGSDGAHDLHGHQKYRVEKRMVH